MIFHAAREAFLRGLHRDKSGLDLRADGEQCGAIGQSPAVELDIGELESVRAELLGQREDGVESIQIVAMQHDVKAERQPRFLHGARSVELGLMRACSGDGIGEQCFVGLEAELDGVESRGLQLTCAREAQRRRRW